LRDKDLGGAKVPPTNPTNFHKEEMKMEKPTTTQFICEVLDEIESNHDFVNDAKCCNLCATLLNIILPLRWSRKANHDLQKSGLVDDENGYGYRKTSRDPKLGLAPTIHANQRNYVRIEKLTKREPATLFSA